MKLKYYEMIFDCMETCNNGRERRVKKSVLTPVFRNGKHTTEIERIKESVDTLMKEHYYDIAYLKTKTKTLLFADHGGQDDK